MAVTCIVVLEMARPGLPSDVFWAWRKQREREEKEGRSQNPLPNSDDKIRIWRGLPKDKDWERFQAFLVRDGWGVVSHRRDFVDSRDEIIERTEER